MKSTPQKLALNVVLASISKILNTVIALGGLMLITRYLGVEQFGLYVTALAIYGLFNALGDWGLYQTATREISRPKANEKIIIGNVFGLRILISGIFLMLAGCATYFTTSDPQLRSALLIILIGYLFYSSYQILIGLFQKRLLMYQITFVELLGKIIQISLVVIVIKLDLGLKFIISSFSFSLFINLILIYLLSRRFIIFKINFQTKKWRNFLKESWPIGLSIFVTFLYFKADSILLKIIKGNTDVGIYGAAYKVLENITFFPGMIIGLTMPIFSYYIFKDKKKFKEIINKNFKLFILLVIPLIITTLFFAEEIIGIVAGNDFMASAEVLRIIIFSLAFIFFGTLFGSILIVAKLQLQQLIALSIVAIFNISANLIFIPKFSYLATSYISVITELLVVVFSLVIIYKNLNFLPKMKKIPQTTLAGLGMLFYFALLKSLPFFFLLITGPLFYFSSLFLLKVITKEEILMLVKKKI